MNLPPPRPLAVYNRSSALIVRRMTGCFLQDPSHATGPQVRQEVDTNLRILLDRIATIHRSTRHPRESLWIDDRSISYRGVRGPLESDEPCSIDTIFDSLDELFDYLEVRFAVEDGVFGGPGLGVHDEDWNVNFGIQGARGFAGVEHNASVEGEVRGWPAFQDL